MKTDDLVAALAAAAVPVDPVRADRRFLLRLSLGVLLALGLMLLFLGPRPDLAAAATLPMFWVKLGLPAAVAGAAWLLLLRLAHPGMRTKGAGAAAVLPLALMSAAGALVLLQAPGSERLALVLGDTWRECLLNIGLLSLPVLLLALVAVRGLAPTRLRLTGAAAGLFAGAAAAFAYAFHCPELAPPFLGAWYVTGILIPCALGAALGRRALRW
ncbi:MAG: DUF1109 domain-containing protein [Comamonadaceae bacterium]|nr:MAG: DUF1109 domain-containing protein [Comamonadaceae bacterium]